MTDKDNEIINCLNDTDGKEHIGIYCADKNGNYTATIKLTDIVDLINRQKEEIENLNVELVGMRGACESYKMHYDNAQAEIEDLKSQIKTMLDVQQFSGGVE
jgi:predicted  nucleic acid-binding Zn-ribbon protein